MNPFGKFRCLRDNAKSALLASLEIYNKPQLAYRDECFVILLANAWELCVKAILSKNRVRIFYPKERDKPYLTLSLRDALNAAKPLFPTTVPYAPVAANLNSLIDYRNNAVHFYNEPGLGVLMYGLSQTAIINFRDIFIACFNQDIAEEVNLSLMPLSFRAPPDPIAFLRSNANSDNKFLSAYLHLISETTESLEKSGADTGRFLTVFSVSLQSTKKITSADVVAGVQTESPEGILLVDRKVDPNKSHPKLQRHVLAEIGPELKGVRFTSYAFQAIVWHYDIKDNPQYYWKPEHGGSSQYSPQLIAFVRGLTRSEIETSIANYRTRNQ
ncbi:DUF3644 domain-containing protein [Aeoliella sp. SH292]|uniref:DUF3644 domain-containing protein n=1 Tax=Aeoliella sp. SH292 TaxID=3454464 RepID=UPI003F9EAE65